MYILRHGETDFNKNGMVQGSGIDAPLNETGRNQAKAFFNAYKHIKFDKIYTSNLQRTSETVRGFTDMGIPNESLSDLREISWGEQEGKAFTPETSTNYQRVVAEWSKGNLDLKIMGGETPREVAQRQKIAFDYILSHEEEETVLICIHGRAMRILFCWMLNYPLHYMDNFGHMNTGLYIVNYTGTMYSIEGFNITDHLKSLN
ncbi:MAG: histidine phosphatase family protein [Cyclobacteriaceae bacterium]